ncbi:MAG: leucine-rich repeat domain-containing protein [Bacteroides sp.]|nr:leucine-rich repeat domain-containing protein [Bacillota bacterium]MCM1393557.1 leucine-rich repeat domain-containing protein [[Eubacterium] siraeum]MCM1455085.1 leucine-rich repeat domain-containing protein [Bacteroides sp.]
MKKKLTITLLALICVLTCTLSLAACGGGGNDDDKNQPQSFYTYELASDGQSYEISRWRGTATEVTLPSEHEGKPVTTIQGINAVDRSVRENLQSVTIPNSFTKISGGTFSDCTALKDVSIPASVKTIGGMAFDDCTSLETVTIAEGLTTIEQFAFRGCSSLKSMVIPDSVTQISWGILHNCTSLESLTLPFASVVQGSILSLFRYNSNDVPSSLRRVEITNTETIDAGAFDRCNHIASLVLPQNLVTIHKDALKGCTRLVEIYNLSEVNIGKSGEEGCDLNTNAFVIHESLTEKSNVQIADGDFVFYVGNDKTLLTDYTGNYADVILPNGIDGKDYTVNDRAFENCETITNLTVPNGVKRINIRSFADCTALKKVIVADGTERIEPYAFANCTALETVVFGNGMQDLFGAVFDGCTALKSVVLGSGIETIWEEALSGCSSLDAIYYKGTAEDWDNIDIQAGNESLADKIYFYNESSTANGWHFAADGVTPVKW